VVFREAEVDLRWPPRPDVARIAYAGRLMSRSEAGGGPDGVLGVLFGRKEVPGMSGPMAVCADDAGRVFVADPGVGGVHVFELETGDYELWTPPEEEAALAMPVGLAVTPENRLLVSDSVDGALFVFDEEGTFLGTLGDGVLQRPVGLAVDGTDGRIFVADASAHVVVILAPDGSELGRVGGRGIGPGQFNFPTYVALGEDGRLFVSDSLNFRIQVFGPDLGHLLSVGSKGGLPGYFAQPKGIGADSAGRLYAVDAHFEAVQVFNREGRLLMTFGSEGGEPGEFWLPAGMHIDGENRIWIADSYNRRVQVFEYVGPGEGVGPGTDGTGAGP
jgi:DNA-binding beta-propeller fold protein YncE